MVVNASNRHKILSWLAEHAGKRGAHWEDRTTGTGMIAVQGPRAVEVCEGLAETETGKLAYYHAAATRVMGKQCIVSRTGYTGEDGLEFMLASANVLPLWEELVRRGIKPCGLGARDTLRLEAAMPLYGHELDEETDPFQAGLAWAVKLDKGDFVGRDALLRRREDPSLPQRIGLELEGRRIAREGAVVLKDGEPVGRVTSGTFSPT